MDLVFATDLGVLGDDQCDSVGVALEIGSKIGTLRVERCHASSEEDKQRIFAHIRSTLGSLERMDDKIKLMMKEMLARNLQHASTATINLRKKLGYE